MEVILTQDINGLGYKNDTVTVKPGYGRNYLIPQGFAIIANNSNAKKIAENIRQAAHKAEKLKQGWRQAVVLRARIMGLQGRKQEAVDYLAEQLGAPPADPPPPSNCSSDWT